MLFNSYAFLFAFLPVTYLVFWALRTARSRYVWLTITGYLFYSYWDWRFCFLMLFSTLVSYGAGIGMLAAGDDQRKRKLFMVVPITVDLLLLGFFKYANFFLDSGQGLAHLFGVDVRVPHLDVILPIGISFYTFHTISYIVDSYRRVVTPTRNFFEFAAYVSLFSQLVAGPIVRFRQIEQDLEALGTADRWRWMHRGVTFFIIGMVEKVVVADSLAAMVDPAMANYATLGSVGTWVAMLGYTFQLYFDFSGYSTMAVGLGFLFGIRIPQNFNSPYKATDPSDFWRRWHISLSSCMRDYLYIPFGGNRGTKWQVDRNLMLTMLIGGLWHGASWTFIVWGAYHGAIQVLYRHQQARWDRLPSAVRRGGMFLAAIIGWVFFRATDFTMATTLLRAMFVPTAGLLPDGTLLALPMLAFAAWWAMRGPNAFDLDVEERRWSWGGAVAAASALGATLALIAGERTSPFLYFQF